MIILLASVLVFMHCDSRCPWLLFTWLTVAITAASIVLMPSHQGEALHEPLLRVLAAQRFHVEGLRSLLEGLGLTVGQNKSI